MSSVRGLRRWPRRVSLALGGIAALMVGVNTNARRQQAPLPPRLDGEQRSYAWRGYHIAYTVRGEGTPLLLIHSINAAASSFELRKVWDGLAYGRRLYALDLLGFGGSDRPDISYNAELYIDLLTDFARDVIGAPTVVLASSMSGSFVIAAAAREPAQWSKLLLVEPTGLTALAQGQTRGGRIAQSTLRTPFIGTFLFNLLVSRPAIRFFLAKRSYHNPAFATPQVIGWYVRTGHQPGARWAPAAFVGGALNSNVRERWAKLPQMVVIAWGQQARTTPINQADAWLAVKPEAKLVSFAGSGDLPHDEDADVFNRMADAFFGDGA